jgi:minimal PKS acyl carrier protein
MKQFSEHQLRDIMHATAGETGDTTELPRDFLDKKFSELDFDSLAVLEIATRIQQELQLSVSDDAIAEMTTPRSVLDFVNGELAA